MATSYLLSLKLKWIYGTLKYKPMKNIQKDFDAQYKPALRSLVGNPHILTFGKYQGKTIGWVVTNDPSYIGWINRNITEFVIKPDIIKEAASMPRTGSGFFSDRDDEFPDFPIDGEF